MLYHFVDILHKRGDLVAWLNPDSTSFDMKQRFGVGMSDVPFPWSLNSMKCKVRLEGQQMQSHRPLHWF